jgi:hypothetical protein
VHFQTFTNPRTCRLALQASAIAATAIVAAHLASGQSADRTRVTGVTGPEAELHIARMICGSGGGDIADDSRHLRLTDDSIYDYPWVFAQQVGRWSLSDAETMTALAYRFGINYVIYAMTHR